jgi:D-lactate dehydrogenase
MRVALFSARSYDIEFFKEFNTKGNFNHDLVFFDVHLNETTMKLAFGFEAVCVFVNDVVSAAVLEELAKHGLKLVALRCAGFNNVALEKAKELGVTVLRVPAYSPYAVAEHAAALILALNRNIHRAYNKVRESNFALDGLLGFDLNGKTAGILGTGKIGAILCKILKQGFGMEVIAYDLYQSKEVLDMGIKYVTLEELYSRSDVISIHVPLLPSTNHMIDAKAIGQMKKGVMIINTSRGPLLDTAAVIEGLKRKQIGYLGIDVYEEEGDMFFEDHSRDINQDDKLSRLLTFPNVLVTGHQAFFTRNALEQIATVTLQNVSDFVSKQVKPAHQVLPPEKKKEEPLKSKN